MLSDFIEKIIGDFKNDPAYKIESSYTVGQLSRILLLRAMQIYRGIFRKVQCKSVGGLIFCGRHVTIMHGKNISVGKSLIIEDGVYIDALSEEGIILGDNVTIAKYSILICTGVIRKKGKGIQVGNNSAIGAQSFIGGQGGVCIGNDVIMGPGVRIFSENHIYKDKKDLIRLQGESRKGVAIGDNCWIGASSTILDGVTIGNGCVIAAGSVVTKDIPSNSVAAGVPTKVVKNR
jgi:acetyltransferase-like isoleucine patch superfamily enzyme